MMILVKYRGGMCARVPEQSLRQLIAADKITHFLRANGWVQVGQDPIRQRVLPFYAGREKRRTWRSSLE
jgi:hypothetical protein